MKTVLFLDRAPLTIFYAKMTPYMEGVKCIHVAYSQKDVEILAEYNIKPDYVYSDLFRHQYDTLSYDESELARIDEDIIKNTNGRFNLNGAVQSDRGFSILTYDETLRSAVAHYKVWETIYNEQHVDLVLHEPCSLFFNFIGCVLCKRQGGAFTYQIASTSDKYEYSYLNAVNDDFSYPEIVDNYNKFISNPSLIDRERCDVFLKKFRENQKAFLGGLLNRKVSAYKLLKEAAKNAFVRHTYKKKYNRIYDNINYWLLQNNRPWMKFKNLMGYKWNNIKFETEIPKGEKYFFFPFHLEPEAAVLYLGDGIYKNQVKLIENIAASLPAGYYLYVKDHPHEFAYREPIDYKRLMAVPNIRLINQWMSSKAIMKDAQGVITINGTAGFEAVLQNKQVYCFGHNMYSFLPRVNYIKNIRDLRDIILDNIEKQYEDDVELRAFVMAYLESSHPGYTDCYSGGVFIDGFDYEGNARNIAADMIRFVNRYV